jgi:hypothetical protein
MSVIIKSNQAQQLIRSLNALEASLANLSNGETIEKAKKVAELFAQIDPAQISSYDFQKIREFAGTKGKLETRLQDRNLFTNVTKTVQFETEECIRGLVKAFNTDFTNRAKKVFTAQETQARKKSHFHKRLGKGICRGLAVAIAENPNQSPTEKTEARARFIQATYLVDYQKNKLDTRAIGEHIVNIPSDEIHPNRFFLRNSILEKAARRMGFANWIEFNASPLSPSIKYDIIGKVAFDKCVAMEQRLNELESSPAKGEPSFILGYLQKEHALLLECLRIKPDKGSEYASKIPETILKKTNLIQKPKVFENVTPSELGQKLKDASLVKGQYILSLADAENHTIYLSFEPYQFFDDKDSRLDAQMNLRGFTTREEFLDFVQGYISAKYPNFKTAYLLPLEKGSAAPTS